MLRQNRCWLWIAVFAIGLALLLLLVPHGLSADASALMALVPLLLIGIISALSLLSPLAFLYLGRTPDSPVLPSSFQRPPPFTLA